MTLGFVDFERAFNTVPRGIVMARVRWGKEEEIKQRGGFV